MPHQIDKLDWLMGNCFFKHFKTIAQDISIFKIKLPSCQGKIEMSGFRQNENVRFMPPPSAGFFV